MASAYASPQWRAVRWFNRLIRYAISCYSQVYDTIIYICIYILLLSYTHLHVYLSIFLSILCMYSFALVQLVALSVAIVGLFGAASYYNYPGGTALSFLIHKHIPHHIPSHMASHIQSSIPYDHSKLGVVRSSTAVRPTVSVHIDASAAMTGVSR